MKIALAQMKMTPEMEINYQKSISLIEEAAQKGASWPLAVKIGKALNTGVDYYLADTSDQCFDIQIDLEISNILKDCDMEGRMAIRDTARRTAEYGKRLQAKKQ